MPETLEMCHDSTRSWRDYHPDAIHSLRHPGVSETQGRRWRDTSKRRWQKGPGRLGWWMVLACIVLSWVSPAAGALLQFQNCLSQSTLDSDPKQLQFVPLDVAVSFDVNNPSHPLNVTVYGNVSGTADQRTDYPSMDDPSWSNPNSTVGKIVDLSTSNNKYSTLLTSFDVLSFTPYENPVRFRDTLIQGDTPLGPVFDYNL